jgi:predicted negative regulator of RcsB-dependent stress response
MSLQKQMSRQQGTALIAAFVLSLGALFGFAAWLRARPSAAPQAVEVAPVQEEVVATPREVAPAAPAGQMSDEQARRRELLESMKWSAQHRR